MEKKNEVISSNILFDDLSDLEKEPIEDDSAFAFSDQRNYGNSLKNEDDALFKRKSKRFNNQPVTTEKFQELAQKNPEKLIDFFF